MNRISHTSALPSDISVEWHYDGVKAECPACSMAYTCWPEDTDEGTMEAAREVVRERAVSHLDTMYGVRNSAGELV